MKDRKLKYIFGFLSLALFVGLIYKIIKLPGGIILPGFFLGGMMLAVVLIGCLIVTGICQFFFKRLSFSTLFYIVSFISFVYCHYYLYSPTLKIVVPKNYSGEVNLVLSNVRKNILTVDSNGIGYINQWTYTKTYTPPEVVDSDGKSINDQCVGFNPSTFWAKGYAETTDKPKIFYLSFKIERIKKDTSMFYVVNDWTSHVDESKLPSPK